MKFTKLAAAITLGLAISAANAATSTANFNVTIKITGTCNALASNSGQPAVITTDTPVIAGADIDFGTYVAATTHAAIDGSSTGALTTGLAVQCSKNTPYTLGLAPTNVASTVGLGTMNGITAGNSDTITYQLFQPTITGTGLAATVANTKSANVWGSDSTGGIPGPGGNVLRFTGKGLGAAATVFPVFATVPANAIDKFVDRYQDRVTATLTY
jgi:hypothetical protein